MSRADDFMLTAEELRLRRRKRRIIIIVISIALLIGIAGIFTARPALNAIKAFQARRHAARAFAKIEEGKWSEARDEALAAYRLRTTEPQSIRAVARYLSRTRQQQALDFWEQLEKQQPLTRDDLRDEAAIALVSGETGRAASATDRLLADNGKLAAPIDWLLGAQLALRKGSPQDASASLRKIFENQKATEREQLQAALLELQAGTLTSGDDSQQLQADAWSRITKISAGKNSDALDALLYLAQRELSSRDGGTGSVPSQKSTDDTHSTSSGQAPVVPPTDLIRAIENHPLAKAPQKLLCLDLLLHDDPSQKQACVDRAIAQWKGADAVSLAALATWLNSKGEYERELETIPLEKALQTRELFLQHVDALGALGRWSEIRQLLESERFPLDAVIQRMYLARCYAQLEQKTASENNWQRALEAAGNDVQKLLTLADYAEKNGATEIAGNAYMTATSETPGLRAAWEGRLRIAQANRDTKKIHAVLGEMLRLWPKDPAIQNDEAYIHLLLLPNEPEAGSQNVNGFAHVPRRTEVGDQGPEIKSQISAIEKLAEDLVKREPASLPHRTLLALALLKQNRAADALQVYTDIRLTPKALSASALAVHAAILSANGHHADAREEVEKLPLDNLLPEERALLPSLP